MNKLFYGDNLDVLREHIASDSVDLVYLDPPFNSNANHHRLQTITPTELFQRKKPDIPFVAPSSLKGAKWENENLREQGLLI